MVALQNDRNYCGKVDEINLFRAQIASKECYTREQHLIEQHTQHGFKSALYDDTIDNNDGAGLLERHLDLSQDSLVKGIQKIENAQESLNAFKESIIVPPRAILQQYGNDIHMDSQKELLNNILSSAGRTSTS